MASLRLGSILLGTSDPERLRDWDEGPPIAWFRDPAGDILSVLQE